MIRNHMLFGALLGAAFLFAGAPAQAGPYEIVHPLCQKTTCTKTTVWFYGADGNEPIDRVNAHIDGTCTVTLNDGSKATASTDSLSLSNGIANSDPISRTWWFPKGCQFQMHVRNEQDWPTPDVIWKKTTTADKNKVFNVYFGNPTAGVG